MPIKFRCHYCRQFLGISQTKAGAVVDCPTCGRSVRVPELDGRVAPIPEPELNLDDSELVQALDELASIGSESSTAEPSNLPASAFPGEPSQMNGLSDDASAAVNPSVVPEPIPLAPLSPGRPVAHPEGSGPGFRLGSAPAPGSSSDVLAPLAALANSQGTSEATVPLRRRQTVRRVTLTAVGIVGTVVVFFVGYVLGHHGSNEGFPGARPPSETLPDAAATNPDAMKSADVSHSAIRGSITYKTESGESRPDRGARVIVFPQGRGGSIKLSVVGFRPGDQEADFKVAVAALRALGGDAAVVAESGTYEITLPAAGNYYVLVLSQFQAREESGVENSELLSVLTQFFDRPPEQLLGRLRYHASPITHKGDGAITWNYSFERD